MSLRSSVMSGWTPALRALRLAVPSEPALMSLPKRGAQGRSDWRARVFSDSQAAASCEGKDSKAKLDLLNAKAAAGMRMTLRRRDVADGSGRAMTD